MDNLAELAKQGRYSEMPNPMTTAEAAEVARRSPRTITRMCKAGAIKAVGYGGKWNINRESLLEFAGLV